MGNSSIFHFEQNYGEAQGVLLTPNPSNVSYPLAPVYIAKKIEGNRFVIAGGRDGMEGSWQVTGIRQDAYANDHRIKVEEQNPASEHGRYLYPDSIAKDRRP